MYRRLPRFPSLRAISFLWRLFGDLWVARDWHRMHTELFVLALWVVLWASPGICDVSMIGKNILPEAGTLEGTRVLTWSMWQIGFMTRAETQTCLDMLVFSGEDYGRDNETPRLWRSEKKKEKQEFLFPAKWNMKTYPTRPNIEHCQTPLQSLPHIYSTHVLYRSPSSRVVLSFCLELWPFPASYS